jgi:hypothetical protein
MSALEKPAARFGRLAVETIEVGGGQFVMGLDDSLMFGLLGEAEFVLRPTFEIILIFVGHFTRKFSTRYALSITNW